VCRTDHVRDTSCHALTGPTSPAALNAGRGSRRGGTTYRHRREAHTMAFDVEIVETTEELLHHPTV
jgi:hypothetical protein